MSKYSPLDPGVPARKRGSFCKFCSYIGLLLAGLFFATLIYTIGQSLFQMTQFSHSRIFQNQTLDEVENRTAVVRPLVDEKQLFDIAVTIWALPVEENIGAGRSDVIETPLYSDIVFRGLRLADKHKTANVTYHLPIAIFQRLLLKEDDIRASFVIIPTAPSLVNQITEFSTWRPEILSIPPVRSWPFPLEAVENTPQSVADRALDSFGISMSLLEFHPFGSKCAESPDVETPSDDSEDPMADKEIQKDDDEDDEKEENYVEEEDNSVGPLGVSDISKYPEHALKRHPFVVTRTQIRVVDETHVFNRKLYNKEHNKLRSTSCGQGRDKKANLTLCHRTYQANGNWETRLELQVPDEKTGELHTEWAYAPYLGYAKASAGPKDIVAVPVTRENCTHFKNASSTDPDFIDINWLLSYSGRSPAKFVMTDSNFAPHRVLYNESDFKKAMAHDQAETLNGFFGHRFYEDAHPRRRLIIGLLLSVLSSVQSLLRVNYWYTRTSTVSISVSGTTFLALHRILLALMNMANKAELQKLEFSTSEWLKWVWLIVWTVAIGFCIPFFMLRTVTRVAFSYNKSRFIPTVRQASPTHMERASQRLDSRPGWSIKVGVCASLIAIHYFTIKYYSFGPLSYHILVPHHPTPGPTDTTEVSNLFAQAYAFASMPLLLTGNLSQFLLNQRSKTFAGRYKITVVVNCIYIMLHLITYLPSVIGRYDARPGLTVAEVIDYIIAAAIAWQAAVFPNATDKTEEEHTQ
ncbi:hypothetical protein K438DRAFT_1932226 [Mycena galopus ATCC 62051]|nr:hypothetical protein K438DRAFT_1932226 [Mycena galopus ATCC 62051]